MLLLNPLQSNGIFYKTTYNKVWMVHPLPRLRGHWITIIISKNILYLSLKVDSVLANSADPDEMLQYAAFHLGLHCLQKCPFRGFLVTKG